VPLNPEIPAHSLLPVIEPLRTQAASQLIAELTLKVLLL
jgi:hypothetical protein